jgi:hypothetical protein
MMSTSLQFEFPISFRATPLKSRSPKMVCGSFLEVFDVPEVDEDEVRPLFDLTIGGERRRYFAIYGRFYQLAGEIDGEDVLSRYAAAKSPIPSVQREYSEMATQAKANAKASGLAIFPKRSPDQVFAEMRLERDWFSDTDLQWLDRRRDEAHSSLAALRCSGGQLYEPMPEPAFVVNIRTERTSAAGVSVRFQASDEDFFYSGFPVAYFNADQQDEAQAYATMLATRHGVSVEPFERRVIEMHDAGGLTFDPTPAHVMEAAYLSLRVMSSRSRDVSSGRTYSAEWRAATERTAEEMATLFGPDPDNWRNDRSGSSTPDNLLVAEKIARERLELLVEAEFFPLFLIETLLERWDDRPIAVSDHSMGGLAV